jgi:hypothetical protein
MTTTEQSLPFSDLSLSRRLERAEGRSNADFVEARASLFPESGAAWIEVAGAYAMFDGIGSPLTQTFGLGVFDPVAQAEMEKLEEFFQQRGAHVHHEVSPIADASLLTLLNERGYQPIELTSVMYRPIGRGVHIASPRNEKILSRLIRDGEEDLWAQTAASGWSEMMCAAPGSSSQRNAERQGFRIAYTRIKWSLTGPSAKNK